MTITEHQLVGAGYFETAEVETTIVHDVHRENHIKSKRRRFMNRGKELKRTTAALQKRNVVLYPLLQAIGALGQPSEALARLEKIVEQARRYREQIIEIDRLRSVAEGKWSVQDEAVRILGTNDPKQAVARLKAIVKERDSACGAILGALAVYEDWMHGRGGTAVSQIADVLRAALPKEAISGQ